MGAALLDLQWGKLTGADAENVDVSAFEKSVAERLGMPAEVQFRYRSPYFRHIFGSDGYASGYYTYLWAEVLDADGFELFTQKGIFDTATAAAFKKYVLEAGGTEDPMELYKKFRGREPRVEALLRVAAANQCETLILGAFACGRLGYDAGRVAQLFRAWVDAHPGAIGKLVFAVPRAYFDAFDALFAAPVVEEPVARSEGEEEELGWSPEDLPEGVTFR